jgi:hypothetical protein
MRLWRPHVTPSLVVSVIALVVALGGSAYAATGDTFLLGKPNSADRTSTLTSSGTSGATLSLVNSGTAHSSTGLNLTVDPGQPPLVTNSSVKVQNLNADTLDGISSGLLVHGNGNAETQHIELPMLFGSKAHFTMGITRIDLFCDLNIAQGASISIAGQANQTDNGYWNAVDRRGPLNGFAVFAPENFVQFTSDGGSNDHGATGTVFMEGPVKGNDTTTTVEFGAVDENDTTCEFQLQALTTHAGPNM